MFRLFLQYIVTKREVKLMTIVWKLYFTVFTSTYILHNMAYNFYLSYSLWKLDLNSFLTSE